MGKPASETIVDQASRIAVDKSSDGILLLNRTGNVIQVNPAMINITGLPEEVFLYKPLISLYERGLCFKVPFGHQALESKTVKTGIQDMSTGNNMVVTAVPVFDTYGLVNYVVAVAQDVNDFRELLKNNLKESGGADNPSRKRSSKLAQGWLTSNKVVVRSEAMRKVMEIACRVAKTNATVLLYGQSGVGKEVVAETIHRESKRSLAPFLRFNCNSMPQELMESEFLGYEKGAFTGANSQGKPGLLEMADGGTLLLDEIADLSLDLQGKFLRLLERQEFRRLGGTRNVRVNVRFIAATNRDLWQMVEQGLFREDLYYRLSVVPMYIPPLQERPEDVDALITYYLNRFNEEYKCHKYLTAETVALLQSYHWPGNVRELINMLERLVIISPNNLIEPRDLIFSMDHFNKHKQLQLPGIPIRISLKEAEKNILAHASQEYGSSRRIAKALGCSHTAVLKKLKKHGLKIASSPM